MLADELMRVDGLEVLDDKAHTNMVFVSLPGCDHDGLLLGERAAADTLRLVTHKQIGDKDIVAAAKIIAGFLKAAK